MKLLLKERGGLQNDEKKVGEKWNAGTKASLTKRVSKKAVAMECIYLAAASTAVVKKNIHKHW